VRRKANRAQEVRILNTVPACQNLYKNSFTYHSLKEDKTLPFAECLEFIEQTRLEKARVLVHCMSGQNRSPAVVIAYLMRYKGWRLPQCYQWVKDRRPTINLSEAVALQLQQFELEVFGNVGISTPIINTGRGVTFGFGGYPSLPLEAAIPTFAPPPGSSSPIPAPIAFGPGGGISYSSNTNFVFGAVRQEQPVARAAMDHSMDSS